METLINRNTHILRARAKISATPTELFTGMAEVQRRVDRLLQEARRICTVIQ